MATLPSEAGAHLDRLPAARGLEAGAARGAQESRMPKAESWTTIALPKELFSEIKARHVPARARSVQSYVAFWARLGCLIDRALAANPDTDELVAQVLAAVREAGKPGGKA